MQYLRRYLLSAIFLLTPILYAWWYFPGIPGNLSTWLGLTWSGFESVKVVFFLICSSLLLLVSIVSIFTDLPRFKVSKNILIGAAIFLIWAIFCYILNQNLNPYFLVGENEKKHGIFFFLAFILIFFQLRNSSSEEQKKYLGLTVISFGVVLLYAIFQKIGFDPMRALYQAPIELTRLFSTLGNPNYLAGYILMLLPILHRNLRSLSPVFLVVWYAAVGAIIFWTGSYLAWILYVAYVFYLLANRTFITKKSRKYFLFMLIGVGLLALIFVSIHFSDLLHMGKFRNFISRFYLWKAGLAAIFHDIPHLIFGYGPDGFLAVSHVFRGPELMVSSARIDSSHNIFIDSALVFGLPLAIIFWIGVMRKFRTLPESYQISLCLFALYFAFNIPVLVHFLILVQILAPKKPE